MAGLLSAAEERKKQNDLVYHRMLLKEREQNDNQFQDKEQFVTEAYRQKLLENKQYEEEKRKQALLEADVTKKKDISGFFASMLNSSASPSSEQQLTEEKLVPERRQSPSKERRRRPRTPSPELRTVSNLKPSDATSQPPATPAVSKSKEEAVKVTVESKHTQESIVSARERYLRRKLEKQTSAQSQE